MLEDKIRIKRTKNYKEKRIIKPLKIQKNEAFTEFCLIIMIMMMTIILSKGTGWKEEI